MGSVTGLENDLIQNTPPRFDAYHQVQAGPLHGVNPLRALVSLGRIAWGTLQAVRVLRRVRPDAIFLTGGWVGAPVAVAAWLLRLPIIIFVPDIEPGQTLKVLGWFARVVTATTADTAAYFPHRRVVATGYPLRQELMSATRAAGQARFRLLADLPTLFVFGGSRGARSINRALLNCVEALLAALDFKLQIVHVTGSLDWDDAQNSHAALPAPVRARYQVHEYLHDIGLAMAAADLVLSRAGASTLGEFPYFHLPAILIPYPYAWRYQRVNAEWLAARGAALVLADEEMPDKLSMLIQDLITDPTRLGAMQKAAAGLALGDGAKNIANIILAEAT